MALSFAARRAGANMAQRTTASASRFAPASRSFEQAKSRSFASSLFTPSSARFASHKLPGTPMIFGYSLDNPDFDPETNIEYEVMPRDEFGVPATVPPELATAIKHTYYVPPQYYPFLKKLGDDTPALKPFMEKLIDGQMTYQDYEEMFYRFSKPIKVYRDELAMPFRTPEEIAKEDVVAWEGKWLSFRQRVFGDYQAQHFMREFLVGMSIGFFVWYILLQQHIHYRIDMKLFYLEAPEHKINWVVPRGDL